MNIFLVQNECVDSHDCYSNVLHHPLGVGAWLQYGMVQDGRRMLDSVYSYGMVWYHTILKTE